LEPTAAGRISKAEREKKEKERRQSDLRCSDPLRIHASQLKLDPMERRGEAAVESGRARPVLFKAKRRIIKEGGEIRSIVRAKKGKAKATAEKSEERELHGPCVSHLHLHPSTTGVCPRIISVCVVILGTLINGDLQQQPSKESTK
jgi:hypothetical protein